MQANFSKKASTKPTLPGLREFPPGRLMAVSDIIPFGQKARAAYPSTYLLGAGITGPRVELKVLESEKIPSRGYGQAPGSLGPGRSLRGYHLLSQAYWGNCLNRPLGIVHPFFLFFSFLDPTHMGQGSGAQGTNRGFNQLKKGHEAVRVTLPLRDFRKNAEPWCADLPLSGF